MDRTAWLPGLQKDERAVWRRWLNVQAQTGDKVAYAVRLGYSATEWPADLQHVDASVRELTALEVDAIIERGGRYLVVEVKPRVCMAAIGQLLVYRYELLRRGMLPSVAGLVCVAGQDHPLLRPTYASLGIEVNIV